MTPVEQEPVLVDAAVVREHVPRSPRRMREGVWLALVVAAPLFVGAAWVLLVQRTKIAPISDLAITEMAVRDVGRHAVLTGPYSRYHWHHPGPALFYLLAIPYRVFGSTSAALYAGAGLINGAALIGTVLLVFRRYGRAFAVWTAAVLAVYVAALSPGLLLSPWNPNVLPVAFLLFAFLAWLLALGERWALAGVAALGSFLVQSHVGYAPAVAAATTFACVRAVIVTRRPDSTGASWRTWWRTWMRMIAISGVLLAVMWLPPVIDQFSSNGGNLGDLASFLVHNHGDHSLGTGIADTTHELGAIPARLLDLGGHANASAEGGARNAPIYAGLLTIAALAGAAIAARRRRATDLLVLIALEACLVVVAAVAISRIVGPVYDFLTVSVSALSAVAWIAIGATFLCLDEPPSKRVASRHSVALVAGSVVLCVCLAGGVISALTTRAPTHAMASPDMLVLAKRVDDALPKDGPGRHAYVGVGQGRSWGVAMGLALQLERRHVPVTVQNYGFMVGRAHSSPKPPPAATRVIVVDAFGRDKVRSDPRLKEIATTKEFSAFVSSSDFVGGSALP